jgi:LPS export ABC transporter protein LptC/lipopolysaccharide transport protein LptA
MTVWQRRLRLGLLLFIVVLAVTLVVLLRRSPQRLAPKPPPARSDPNAVVESTSGTSVRFLGLRQDVTIEHYDWMGQYPDGRTKFTGGVIKVLQRGGRDFLIKARDAEMKGQPPNVDVTLKGSVEVTSSDGLVLKTDEATFVDGEGVVRAPGPVAFTRGRMSGTAVGMTYDKNRDVLWLLDQVVIRNQPDEKGQGGADIDAGAAGLARADKYMRFDRGVKIVRDGQTIQADGGVAYLTPDEQRVQLLELRGSSRVAGTPKAEGGLKNMAARDMNLTYGEDGKTLQRALLSGDGVIDLFGGAGRAGRRLSAQFIDIGLGPDGAVVTALLARERVVLELAADKATPARTIRSGALQCSGTPAAGLTDAAFSEGVDFRETPPPPAKPRVARSSTMSLALKNGFNSIESARFFGGVQFEQGAMAASAREARYQITEGTLAMAGADEQTGRPPHVLDDQATIEGKSLTIVLDGEKITAVDSVKTEMRDSAQPGGRRGADGAARRRPGLLKQDKPVYAISDRLAYDGSTSRAEYTGNAQLWQGEMRIKANEIVVDDESGNLTATGGVDSRLLLEQFNAKTKAKEQVKSVATAKDMVYDDSVRRATYTGSARLNGPDGDLAADKIEIYLLEGGSEIDHLEAYTGVTLRTPDGRRAAGNRLTYLAKDEQYDMFGTPVTLEDESGQTTGSSLRFFRSTDRIIVDGKEQRRTELKRGIKR